MIEKLKDLAEQLGAGIINEDQFLLRIASLVVSAGPDEVAELVDMIGEIPDDSDDDEAE